MNYFLSLVLFLFSIASAYSQVIKGQVVYKGQPVANIAVGIPALGIGTSTAENGTFSLENIPAGNHQLQVRGIGYQTITEIVSASSAEAQNLKLALEKDVLNLEQVVVTASRNEVEIQKAPVVVSKISERTFTANQAQNAAEGLSFTPGLRVENNCQNCGFTQLRMNGLDGAYSQVLINSNAVFSSLSGVYGLELLPASMIDRVEVVRGGGSVLFGGNAIGGTVNIITKKPLVNSASASINQAFINGESSDRSIQANASLISKNYQTGVALYAFNRNREAWDANGDGFTELTELENTTFGGSLFHEFSDELELDFSFYTISEYRRGGNKLDRAPHLSDIAEELNHEILGANTALNWKSINRKHRAKLYLAAQGTDRNSYYGGGGRTITNPNTVTQDDLLAINAYGNSTDLATSSGIQYMGQIHEKAQVLLGTEWLHNSVADRMPGYQRNIEQTVNTWGSYAEVTLNPLEKLTLQAGLRADLVDINGTYDFTDSSFINQRSIPVLIPRINALYNITDNWRVRASYAQGYRAPQAFNEDLHIETVGGAARFIQLDPSLEMERSNSFNASISYGKSQGQQQIQIVLEGFYTALQNPFIFSDAQELPNGIAVVRKRNGDGAFVSGANLEFQYAHSEQLIVQSGFTLQEARYAAKEVIWSAPENSSDQDVSTNQLLRTPNTYGYLSGIYEVLSSLTVNLSSVYTGSMSVPHVIRPSDEYTIIQKTPDFFELNTKLNYALGMGENTRMELFVGVQNIFNSYQSDFDSGTLRDAAYVYGPLRPRTYFAGLSIKVD